jgi:hypothetical protein
MQPIAQEQGSLTIWLISCGPSGRTRMPLVRLMAYAPGFTCAGRRQPLAWPQS